MYNLQTYYTGGNLLSFQPDDASIIVKDITILVLKHCQLYALDEKPEENAHPGSHFIDVQHEHSIYGQCVTGI